MFYFYFPLFIYAFSVHNTNQNGKTRILHIPTTAAVNKSMSPSHKVISLPLFPFFSNIRLIYLFNGTYVAIMSTGYGPRSNQIVTSLKWRNRNRLSIPDLTIPHYGKGCLIVLICFITKLGFIISDASWIISLPLTLTRNAP